MKSKNHIILQAIIFSCFIVCIFALVGCSETTTSVSTLQMISNNMTKITNTLDNVKNIDNSELILSDFMDENKLERITTNKINENESSEAMNSYMAKISSLNNSVISTVELNNLLNNTKKEIYAKTSYVKALCNQNLDCKADFSDDQLNTLKDLNNTLIANNTRINLSRNEITNNFNSVKKDQNMYSSNPDYLNSRYTKLKTSLNTRLSYFYNLASGLDQVAEILCNNSYKCGLPYIADDYIFDEPELTDSVTTSSNNMNKETKTGFFKKNIDTYENAGTNMYGDYRNNPIYNKDNYLRNMNPGYGMGGYNMGYGGYGMYGIPYGYGMGGYNMGYGGMHNYVMPYYNGYIYPNINTFGSYKNIDTYRSREQLDKQQIQEQLENEQNLIQKDIENKDLRPMPYPMPRPQPIPRPYPTQKPIPNVEEKVEPDMANKPMPLPNFDEELNILEPKNENNDVITSSTQNVKPDIAKNEDEQFVDKQEEPKIEKIVDGDWVVYKIEF